ncbi:putative major facilitator superfamily, MFS transporter superfamily [Septoria linicola]|nr:putative major facilitator superfamily, MFS transporter superfamily [Septoria linicola]
MEPFRVVNYIRSTPKAMEDKIPFTLANGDPYKHVAAVIRHDEQKGLDSSEMPDYHDKEVKKILRKVDYRLPSVLAILYLFSFLDRSNIGNAKIAGMTKTLKMTGHDYNIALTVFFFPYALFMIPSNLILKKVRPATWLAFLMTCWGTAMMCHGWVKTKDQLIACRVLLGLFESGFFPGAQFLCTLWYCRFEYQFRVALFWCSATLAGAFSGLLAYGIEKMDGIAGYEGWRWIFILEGIATILVGIATYWMLPNSPQSCKFLNDAEKDIIRRRLEQDSGTTEGTVVNKLHGEKFQWKFLKNTMLDWRLWLAGVMVCGQSIPFYAFSFFSPTIIKELGYETWEAQLMTVPIYLLACVVTLAVSIYADTRQQRWKFVVVPYLVAAVGFIALLSIPHPRYPGVTYGFLYLIPMGLSCGVNALIAWIGNNLAPTYRRAIGMAFMSGLANLGGSIGANLYLEEEAPRYPLGFGFSLGVLCAGVVAAMTLKYQLEKINRQRDTMSAEHVRELYTEQQLLELGDKSPLYRYVI